MDTDNASIFIQQSTGALLFREENGACQMLRREFGEEDDESFEWFDLDEKARRTYDSYIEVLQPDCDFVRLMDEQKKGEGEEVWKRKSRWCS